MHHIKPKTAHAPLGFKKSTYLGMKNGYTTFVEDSGSISEHRKVTDRYWYFNDNFDYLLSSPLTAESLGRQRQVKCAKANKGKGLPPSKQSRYFSLERGFFSFEIAFKDFLILYNSFDINRMRSLLNKTRSEDKKYLIRTGNIQGGSAPTIRSYIPSISQEDADFFAFYLIHQDLIDCYYTTTKGK